MATYKTHGFRLGKTLIIKKGLFVFQFELAIDADEPQNFNTTSNRIFLGCGFNLKLGEAIPGINLRWGVKHHPFGQ